MTNIEKTASTEIALSNCFRADTNKICEGMPAARRGKHDIFVTGTGLSACKEVVEKNENMLFLASLWTEGTPTFGVLRADDTANYVHIDTGVAGAEQHALQGIYSEFGKPVELYRGRSENGLLFLYQMLPGDQIIVLTADGKLHGLQSVLRDIDPFDIETARVAEIKRAIQLSEAKLLVGLTGEKAKGARQAGFHRLLDLFANGVDGGAEAFDSLFAAQRAGELGNEATVRYLKLVQPRILRLVERYGLVVGRKGNEVLWRHRGESIAAYEPARKKGALSQTEVDNVRMARRTRDLARMAR